MRTTISRSKLLYTVPLVTLLAPLAAAAQVAAGGQV
jgi:hypothetical protein